MRFLVLVLSFSLVFSGAVSAPNKDLAIVHISGEINEISAAVFIKDLAEAVRSLPPAGTVDVYINSPGGSVLEGYRMIEAIKSVQYKGYAVNTVCTNLCASMGAMILEFGTERRAASTAVILFHHAFYGNDPDRRDAGLQTVQHAALEQIAFRTGIAESVWLQAYKEIGDLWFSGFDAMRMKLIDRIVILELEDI